jgi:plastocyanin
MKRLTLILGSLALAAMLAACSGAAADSATGSPATGSPAGSPSGGTISVVARDMAFVTPAISAKANAAFTIAFDNQDGAPHNIAISDASGSQVFKGDIVTKSTIDYRVKALAPGTYAFKCEVHPDMKGTITVE